MRRYLVGVYWSGVRADEPGELSRNDGFSPKGGLGLLFEPSGGHGDFETLPHEMIAPTGKHRREEALRRDEHPAEMRHQDLQCCRSVSFILGNARSERREAPPRRMQEDDWKRSRRVWRDSKPEDQWRSKVGALWLQVQCVARHLSVDSEAGRRWIEGRDFDVGNSHARWQSAYWDEELHLVIGREHYVVQSLFNLRGIVFRIRYKGGRTGDRCGCRRCRSRLRGTCRCRQGGDCRRRGSRSA